MMSRERSAGPRCWISGASGREKREQSGLGPAAVTRVGWASDLDLSLIRHDPVGRQLWGAAVGLGCCLSPCTCWRLETTCPPVRSGAQSPPMPLGLPKREVQREHVARCRACVRTASLRPSRPAVRSPPSWSWSSLCLPHLRNKTHENNVTCPGPSVYFSRLTSLLPEPP